MTTFTNPIEWWEALCAHAKENPSGRWRIADGEYAIGYAMEDETFSCETGPDFEAFVGMQDSGERIKTYGDAYLTVHSALTYGDKGRKALATWLDGVGLRGH